MKKFIVLPIITRIASKKELQLENKIDELPLESTLFYGIEACSHDSRL
jgi:hypothetical protein